MAVSETALTSLARAQLYLSDTGNVALMEFAIDSVSARIEDWLRRKIVSQSYSEIYQVPTSQLVLRQPDVTAIDFLALDTEDGLRIKYTGSDTDARIEVTDAALKQVSRAGATTTTTSSTFAANVTTTALATTAGAISGWTATVVNARPSAYLVRTGSVSTKDNELTLQVWEWYDGEYTTYYPAGLIDFNGLVSWPYHTRASFGSTTGQMRVDYTAGYSSIPADIELTCLEMLKEVWDLKKVNTALQSESLGDYSMTLASKVSVDDRAEWMERIGTYQRTLP